jgi:hypothetical protein
MSRIRTMLVPMTVLALVSILGCTKPSVDNEKGSSAGSSTQGSKIELGEVPYTILGPHSHENLTVFVLTSDKQDDTDYLTLDEGLKSGDVKVAEMELETVGALQIENTSDRPLFLQEGERLEGGQQDRVIIASLVIPPKSGKTSIPTFCVEHDRWQVTENGKKFGAATNPSLATKAVRGESKIEDSQANVWKSVGTTKANSVNMLATGNKNSSINEMLDDPKVRKLSEEYAEALKCAINGPGGEKVVGVVIVLNNAIEEVDVYPNHKVLESMYPRLVLSYALYAAMLKGDGNSDKPAQTVDTIAEFLTAKADESAEASKREKVLDPCNLCTVTALDTDKYQCVTKYKDKQVHWQIITKMAEKEKGSGSASGSSWREKIFGSRY